MAIAQWTKIREAATTLVLCAVSYGAFVYVARFLYLKLLCSLDAGYEKSILTEGRVCGVENCVKTQFVATLQGQK
jgi:hypothetical protein